MDLSLGILKILQFHYPWCSPFIVINGTRGLTVIKTIKDVFYWKLQILYPKRFYVYFLSCLSKRLTMKFEATATWGKWIGSVEKSDFSLNHFYCLVILVASGPSVHINQLWASTAFFVYIIQLLHFTSSGIRNFELFIDIENLVTTVASLYWLTFPHKLVWAPWMV